MDARRAKVRVSATAANVQRITAPSDKILTITDDDTRGVTLSETALNLDEGGSGTYTVVLDTEPTGAVTVTPVRLSGDTDVSALPGTLSFTMDDWKMAQTVTVSARQDTDAANDAAVIIHRVSGADYNGVSEALMNVTVDDDDTRAVTLSETALNLVEGGSRTYTVVLDTEPAGTVTVTPVRSGDADVTVSAPLSFIVHNWNTPQRVTVMAGEDADAADDAAVISHTVSGADVDYNGVSAPSVDVTVDDNEMASTGVTLSVSPDEVGEGAGATTVTVTARLNGGTRGSDTAVTVTVGSDTAVSGTDFTAVTGFTITIGANQAFGTGTFRLTPTDDSTDEPDETVAITGSAPESLTVTPATLTIEDNDAAPTVTLALSSTSISEDGGVSTVTATLNHASSEATTVEVSAVARRSTSNSDFSLSMNTTLTIAAGATTSSGTVTITAVDNNTVAASAKSVRVSATAANVQRITAPSNKILTITDDDTRGVTVSATALEIEEGRTGTYTVVLDSEPTGAVTVTPAPSNNSDSDVSVSAALSFTALNWATQQTVTVSAGQGRRCAE